MQEATEIRARWIALSLVVALAILAADLALPLGVAVALPYAALVLIGLWVHWINSIYVLASVGTVFLLCGYFLSPEGGLAWVVLANRTLSLLAIWVTAVLGARTLRYKEGHRKMEETLRTAHEDLRRTNRELQSSETKFRALLETTQDGVVISDDRGGIVLVNALAERMFGYARDELLGTPAVMLVPEEHRERHSTRLAAFVKDPKARLMDSGLNSSGRRKDGTSFPVSIRLNPVRGNRELLIVAVLRDVSDQRRAERQLQRAQKMDAVGKLAGGIVHDFNNILTVIRGYSALIADQLSDGRLRRNAEAITKATDRAGLLTRQLLAFSRREQTNVQVIDLDRFLNEIDPVLRLTIGEDIDLRMTFAPGGSRIEIDPAQMEQVILNLAVNARDAMPSGGRLTIETASIHLAAPDGDGDVSVEPGEYILLAVSDTGGGMDEETLAHIFDPFFTTKESGKGTGLGLPAVYGIVKQRGGAICAHSTPGAGAVFEIYFPKADRPEFVSEESCKTWQEPVQRKHTILLVEDDEGLRTLVSRVLRSNGYVVLTAGDPVEAMRLIRDKASADLLLTDVVMPRLGGVELARKLMDIQPRLKVLFMSGYTGSKIRQVQNFGNEMPILEKPFPPEDLLTKVAETLERPQPKFLDRGDTDSGKVKSWSAAGQNLSL